MARQRAKSRLRRRRSKTRRRTKRGRGGSYETSLTRRRRMPTGGRGIGSILKGLGRFAAKNAPQILKGARHLAGKSGNKTLKAIADSELLDAGANTLSKRFEGRGATKANKARAQARNAVNRLIKIYGKEGTRKILRSYMRAHGRGAVGKVLGGILSTIFPF